MKKYEMATNYTLNVDGQTLCRVRALIDFILANGKQVHAGDLGGYIESERNLSQEGKCWVGGNSWVMNGGKVTENGLADEEALVDYSVVSGDAIARGHSQLLSGSELTENAVAEENAFIERSKVSGHAIATGDVWIVDGSELTDNCVAGGSAKILHGSKLSGNKKIYSGIW